MYFLQQQNSLGTIEEQQENANEIIVPYYEATSLQSSAPKLNNSNNKPETAELGVQYDDTVSNLNIILGFYVLITKSCIPFQSYTKMKAFDFYSLEAQRNAKKLTERGRQLQEDINRKRQDLKNRRNLRK